MKVKWLTVSSVEDIPGGVAVKFSALTNSKLVEVMILNMDKTDYKVGERIYLVSELSLRSLGFVID